VWTVNLSSCSSLYTIILNIAGLDFTPGRYTATFTSGATTATASIPIIVDNIDEPTEQFSLRLYIDGAGYGMGLQKGNIATATAIIMLSKFVFHLFLSIYTM